MKTLEEMTVRELKDYILGLYAIPLKQFTSKDRINMAEAKLVLVRRGYETIFKGEGHIVFRKFSLAERGQLNGDRAWSLLK